MFISNDIKYIGVNDYQIDMFEGQYKVPEGISYNSYLILDEKVAVMDTVDLPFRDEWLEKLERALEGRKPDYLVVHHMEPDHSSNIMEFVQRWPEAKIVATAKAFVMMKNFFGTDFADRQIPVKDGEKLSLGRHELSFVHAPMIHWPEVMMTYDSCAKALFSADAFGRFGALDKEMDWDDEARRYYIGIVGKYGAQVQALLKKVSAFDIQIICSLHGPVLNENISHYMGLYDTWSSYRPEEEGVLIAYGSIYGNTAKAARKLAELLEKRGCPKVEVIDLARCDVFRAVSEAFRYSNIVFASSTYNGDVFPFMKEFIDHLLLRNFRSRAVAFIENGSWAPMSMRVMKSMLEKSKDLSYYDNNVKILSAMDEENLSQLEALAEEICVKNNYGIPAVNEQAPEEAPEDSGKAQTVMKKYVCDICSWEYSEELGCEELGIAPGTKFEDLPDDFHCPLCFAGKDSFVEG